MTAPITAAMLYDLVTCPHRVTMDLFGSADDRGPPNPFVKLLWERGTRHENEVMAGLDLPFLDLSPFAGEEKERRTLEAMRHGESLIYSGRIQADGLLGNPDLLRKEGAGYAAGDIKSGAGREGSETKPKKHYAMQLALYTDILERRGLSARRGGFIWDISGEEVSLDLTQPYGARNYWQDYQEYLAEAQAIVARRSETLAAFSGVCKLCHWHQACLAQLTAADDLTLIPELGRSKRDVMRGEVATIRDFATADPARFLIGSKTIFTGIGRATLEKLHGRARLIAAGESARPYLREPVALPTAALELFFDIEVDPLRDICYLHGFIERRDGDNGTERFVAFFAEEPTEAAEREAFASAWRYLQSSRPCVVYYYSNYERTCYRKLHAKYPEVCSEKELEALFDPAQAVDLYADVVRRSTEWPTRDLSIKTLASYLGFTWRDTHPSGAASIEWFDRWIETADPEVRRRILAYNEDDCRATRVLRDALPTLPVMTGSSP